MGSNQNRWTLEKMQNYCNGLNIKYKILDMKWIEKSYQKQQWVLVKCPNENHEPYWTWWNHFKKGKRCKQCYLESRNFKEWTIEEINILKNNSDLTYEEIYQKFLPYRSLSSIRSKAQKEGLFRTYFLNEEHIVIFKNNSKLSLLEIRDKFFPRKSLISLRMFCNKHNINLPKISKWHNDDIEFLKNFNGLYSLPELKVILNKSYQSIYYKCISLGIDYKEISKRWNENEIYFLISNYNNMTISQIVKILGKSYSAVYAKCTDLNIKPIRSDNFWTNHEDNILKQNNNLSMKEMQNLYFPNKSIASINHRIQRLGLQKYNLEHYSKEQIEIYIKYASQYDLFELCDLLNLPETKINYLKNKTGINYKCISKKSKMELYTESFLNHKSIKFLDQYSTFGCRYINPLRFDFAILDDNNNIILLIEINGRQHYEPVEYFGGKKAFLKQQERDKIKRKYCEDNNIKLLEIPYWDFYQIDNILEKEINHLLFKNIA